MSDEGNTGTVKRKWQSWLFAVLAYFVITLFMTYPLIVKFNDSLAGYHGDIMIFMWNRWWLREVWQTKSNPFYTTALFYPQGASLAFHSMSWLNVITWLVLEPLFGRTGSYNFAALGNFMLCGVSTFALLRTLGVRDGIAFVGGLIYAFYPHHVSNILTQPNLASVQWLPLYMLFLMRATRGAGGVAGVLAGLFLSLTALSDWHLLTMMGVLTLLWLVYSVSRERRTWHWCSLRNILIIAIVASALTAPFLFPVLEYFAEGGRLADITTSQEHIYQSDVLAYLVPSRLHPIWGPRLESFYGTYFIRHRNWQAFPGYVVLALLGYIFARHRRGAFWALAALVLWVFALGPYLRVAGRLVTEVPLPYQMVRGLPVFRMLRAPDRLNALLALPVSVLAALSLDDLSSKIGQRLGGRAACWATVILGGLILFEFLVVPLPMRQLRAPLFYESLCSESDTFAVADIPVGWRASRHYMYYQTVHNHPIVEGHISRPIGPAYRFIHQSPLLSRVVQDGDWIIDLPDISRQLDVLAQAGIRYVVVHKEIVKERQLSVWLDWITIQPVYEDEQVLVYETQPECGRDFQWQHDLGTEVGIIQTSLEAGNLSQGGVLEAEIRWGGRAAPGRNLMAEVALVSEDGQVAQQVRWPVVEDWPTDQWQAGEVAIGRYRFQIDPLIPGGVYLVRVSLLDAESLSLVGKSAIIDTLMIHELPRRFAPLEPETALDVFFGDQLRLLGYDMQVDRQSLTLTLHWQAMCQKCEMWKFFVHVVDPNTRVVVAQADVVPRDWTYPTNWWAPGEYVDDTIVVSLEGLPSGDFQVVVGVYHPDTGARLLTTTGVDQVVLPDRIDR